VAPSGPNRDSGLTKSARCCPCECRCSSECATDCLLCCGRCGHDSRSTLDGLRLEGRLTVRRLPFSRQSRPPPPGYSSQTPRHRATRNAAPWTRAFRGAHLLDKSIV
jgi:hypothetical protein